MRSELHLDFYEVIAAVIGPLTELVDAENPCRLVAYAHGFASDDSYVIEYADPVMVETSLTPPLTFEVTPRLPVTLSTARFAAPELVWWDRVELVGCSGRILIVTPLYFERPSTDLCYTPDQFAET